MRIYFGAAILEKCTDVSKSCYNSWDIPGKGSMSRSREAGASSRCILVQNENGKHITKDHAHQDQADAAKRKQPSRAERHERIARFTRDGVRG